MLPNAPPYRPGDFPLAETDDRRLFCKYHYKGVLTLVIPIVLGPILALQPVLICRFIYISLCMYLFYVLNLIARGAIAFTYIIFIPLAGIAATNKVCMSYYTDLLFMTYGCIFIVIMMDSSKLSAHLGFGVIRIVGSNIQRLQIFLTILVFLISYFVNPTAGVAFGVKVAQAVLEEYEAANVVKKNSEEPRFEPGTLPYPTRPAVGIYLTCCYTGTLAGAISPFVNPNGLITDAIPGLKIEHLMLIMLVPALLGILVMLLWLQILFFGLLGGSVKRDLRELAANKPGFQQSVADRKQALGPWKAHAILALIFILLTFIIMNTRLPRIYPGWVDISPKIIEGLSVQSLGIIFVFIAVPANYLFCRYYACREPEKPGTAPSLLSWKAVQNNTPWGDVLMLGAGFACVYCAQESGFYAAVADSVAGAKHGDTLQFIAGACFGTLFTNLSPATALGQIALPIMTRAGNNFALPFATAIHNQFLLPLSSPGNSIVSGFGNVRPYQFLYAGIVPTLFMLVVNAAFTSIFFNTAIPS